MSTNGLIDFDIENEFENNLTSNSSQKGFLLSEVIDNRDPLCEGRVKLRIHKLMPDKSPSEPPVEINYQISGGQNYLNDGVSANLDINEVNGLWARPLTMFNSGSTNWDHENNTYSPDGSYRVPRIGTFVLAIFLEGDQQKLYYFPFAVTFTGDKPSATLGNEPANWNNAQANPNIDLVRKYWNDVRIEVDTNFNSNSIALTVPRQDGEKYKASQSESNETKPNDECYTQFKIEDNPTIQRIGFAHADGNKFWIDTKTITALHDKQHSAIIDEENLTAKHVNNHIIQITPKSIIIRHNNGHIITITDDQIDMKHNDGTKIDINSDNVTIVGNNVTKVIGDLTVSGNLTVSGKAVIGGDAIIGGISFLGHRHPAAHGPTGTPF